ncbi:MAG: CvpA family protein [Candidatus Izemoplasmatales bacterium]|nr:CvpA family protein [bacterium]MDZ4196327.1 CvpA family protein [Candidatus Izemoplasmatales bacterium]
MTIVSFGSFGIGIIDIVMVLSILIFAIIGWKTGFLLNIVKMASGIFGIVGSILLARPFSTILDGWIGETISTGINSFLVEKIGNLTSAFTPETIRESVVEAFPTFPAFLHDMIAGAITPEMVADGTSSIINTLQPMLTSLALLVISFIVLFFGSIIIFFFLKILAKMITSLPIIKQIDKVLGLIFGLIKVAAILLILLFVLSLLLTIPTVYNMIGTFVETDMALTVTEEFRLSKWLFNNNILQVIISAFL